ncbi:MAG TPA: CoA transferase [Candidatus Acidoferrum sp.]|nr:CoA transferase [Candidatus Acidoferrum sp.]
MRLQPPDFDRPLSGIRVIDQAGECGELCGRLLADLGAEVIRVEPTAGAESRRLPPFHGDTSLYFAVRNLGKKSVTLDMESADGRRRLDRLLDSADVWIESHRADNLYRREFLERYPSLVITSITPFGLTGPYRDYNATDAVLVAMSGLLFRSGVPGKPPLLPPGALAYDIAGTTAAFATVAALWHRAQTGRGDHLDVSVMEAAAQTSDWALPNFSAAKARGGQYFEMRTGNAPIYTMYPCADGYVRLIILNARQWRSMRAWLGEPQVLQPEHFDHLLGRMSIQTDILDPMYAEFFKDKTKVELAREAQRRGLAMTPVLTPDEVLAADHFASRKTFRDTDVADGVHGRVADGFFILDGRRLGITGRAPNVGEHNNENETLAPITKSAPAPNSARSGYPFTGIRVLDFGIGGVGVEAGRLLAEYGADVIKIETRAHPDFIRAIFGTEMNPSFASSSRCKRSFGINLRTERGLEIIKRLVAVSDVVIENSSTGTMEKIGLGFDQMRKINPRIVLVSSQLMGATGPWKDWIGFGPNSRTAGAMTYLWNFPEGGMPPGSGAIHPDHLAGRLLALGAVSTLIARERRGVGGHLEVAQVEVIIGLLADLMLKASIDPGSVGPQGNLSVRGAPWGVYPCTGNERWCAITVRDDNDWRRFRDAIGDPQWARAREYETTRGRIEARAEIDRRVAEWTSARSDREVTDVLQRAGVPAGFMMYASDMPADPHLVARGYPQSVEQPGVGAMMFEGPAFQATSIREPIVAPAPALGEHTREICRTILRMEDADVSKLVTEGVLEVSEGKHS